MKSWVYVLFFIAFFCGCKKTHVLPVSNPDTLKKTSADTNKTVTNNTFNYLALGDSYTIGQSEPADVSYPVQLTSYLNIHSFYFSYPTIIAKTGWTTTDLINAIAQSNITKNKYQVVTLLIGVNDQFGGYSQATYRTNFVQLLHTAINFAEGDSTRVFVLSIPDYGVTPFAMGRDSIIGPQIDQFNAINHDECVKAGVNYVDITAISRQAATDSTLIAPDGLHPSGKMYQLWVNVLGPLVLKRLQLK